MNRFALAIAPAQQHHAARNTARTSEAIIAADCHAQATLIAREGAGVCAAPGWVSVGFGGNAKVWFPFACGRVAAGMGTMVEVPDVIVVKAAACVVL
jgi:hypothetical protein